MRHHIKKSVYKSLQKQVCQKSSICSHFSMMMWSMTNVNDWTIILTKCSSDFHPPPNEKKPAWNVKPFLKLFVLISFCSFKWKWNYLSFDELLVKNKFRIEHMVFFFFFVVNVNHEKLLEIPTTTTFHVESMDIIVCIALYCRERKIN